MADIDLKDPELSKAALKIQGKFRLKNKKSAPEESPSNASNEATPAANGDNGSASSEPPATDQQKDDVSLKLIWLIVLSMFVI